MDGLFGYDFEQVRDHPRKKLDGKIGRSSLSREKIGRKNWTGFCGSHCSAVNAGSAVNDGSAVNGGSAVNAGPAVNASFRMSPRLTLDHVWGEGGCFEPAPQK